MPERHAVDAVADDLIRTYERGIRRLEALVDDALRRGLDPARIGQLGARAGDATAAYRQRQLLAARSILDDLRREGAAAGPRAALAAYQSAIYAVDRVTLGAGLAAIDTRFGGVHERAVARLAGNLASSLDAAARTVGENIADVFARADALEGGLPPDSLAGFLGRRVDDPWRRVALETTGEGLVALSTRREISDALYRNLIAEGVTDATTGFVDAAGRRWTLDRYAAMVGRTTTREAASAATVNRLGEHGLDLVTVSSHPHAADECTPYDGQTFTLSGDDERYDELGEMPPFHPNCRHVLTPASASFDDFENELATAAEQGLGSADVGVDAPAPGAPTAPPAPTVGTPPLSPTASPSSAAASAGRAEAESRVASWALDPGAERGAAAARTAWQDATAADVERFERARKRSDLAALRDALGPDMVAALDDFAKSGVSWARDEDLLRALRDGEVDLDYLEELAEAELKARAGRSAARAAGKAERGLRRRQFPCFVCGRFKSRPADVCSHCGDDPVSYGGDAHAFNRAYGYAD